MPLLAKVGSFTKPVGAAPVAQSIVGVGFQPKALILWGSAQLVEGIASWSRFGLGFSDGTDSYGVSAISVDAIPLQPLPLRSHDFVAFNSFNSKAALTSFDADGFTLNWTPNTALADIVHYLAIGGDGVQAKVDTFIDSVVGLQSVAGVGFQPDVVLFTGIIAGEVFGPPYSDGRSAPVNLGMAAKASQQAALSSVVNIFHLNTARAQRTDRCIYALDVPTPGGQAEADFVSMGADGFTLDWTLGGGFRWGYLALKGGAFAIGSESQPTSPGIKSTTGLGFTPSALLLPAFNRLASAAIEPHARISLGAASASDEGAIWGGHTSLLIPTSVDRAVTISKALQLIDTDAPVGVDAEADLQSLDADGFTLDWTTADPFAREFLYLAIGPTPPIPGEPIFTATNPASPDEDNTPFIIGLADPGSIVQLYTDPACTVPIGPPTPAAAFAAPGIQVTVADSSTTTFYADATNAGGTSPCSSDSITYTNLLPIGPILQVIFDCLRLGVIIHPATWASALPASGYVLLLAPDWPDPSGFVESGEDCETWNQPVAAPPGSGYTKEEGSSKPWDL